MNPIKPSSKNVVVSLTPKEVAAIFEAIDYWESGWNDALNEGSREVTAVQKRLESVATKFRKATK